MGNCSCKTFGVGTDVALGLIGGGTMSELTAVIDSYTKGLKTRLRESMEQYSLTGTVTKTILQPREALYVQSNPIHTVVVARGTALNVGTFSGVLDDIVDVGVDVDKKMRDLPPALTPRPREGGPARDKKPSHEEKKEGAEESGNLALIVKTSERLATRKGSDPGDDPEERRGASFAGKAKGVAGDKTRQLMSMMSNIPVLAAYAEGVEEKWSIRVKEEPRTLITATSLFHPFGVYSFPLYSGDGPSVLAACLKWRLDVPFEALELYTVSGIRLTDVDTLQKEKQCVYVDVRVTEAFFGTPTEREFKKLLTSVVAEPFVFHKFALHKLTLAALKQSLIPMNEERAVSILRDDLGVSGIVALRILTLVKTAT